MALAAAGLRQGLRAANADAARPSETKPWGVYLQFVGITIVNPLTVIYFAAFVIGRDPAAGLYSPAANLSFVLGVALASLSWQTLLAAIGGLAGSRLSPRFRLLAVIVGNLIVLALGVRILIEALA